MTRPAPATAALAHGAAARPPVASYEDAVRAYDRRTRAAFGVMGLRYNVFSAAKDAFLAAEPRTPEWYELAEQMYRRGMRSTDAYYLWIRGHTALVGAPPAVAKSAAEPLLRLVPVD